MRLGDLAVRERDSREVNGWVSMLIGDGRTARHEDGRLEMIRLSSVCTFVSMHVWG